ncbi:MAG: hypothetical protein ABEH38_04100 [Flavobacteriales bacterium]
MKSLLAKLLPLLSLLLGTSAPGKAQKKVHVMVPLCDHEAQTVISSSDKRCDGQSPTQNLYWGARYGIRSFFERNPSWSLISSFPKDDTLLDRLLFQHDSSDTYMLAEAYDGRQMLPCLRDFFAYSNGRSLQIVKVGGKTLRFGRGANLIAFCGHKGLMDHGGADFSAQLQPAAAEKDKEVVILACESKSYFRPYIEKSSAQGLLWTSGFMAPEAYILEGVLDEWMVGASERRIRESAAKAYNEYQDCGLSAAKRLFLCKE